ncbi:type I restriction endonuclease subunit R [Thauera sp.]|jgi:type I restriction enzyme R subunit|uniref:type I restriction endonuclease subunit R n=1 Tax=Thauera sp. TaxID=1905334 RepID=UPI002A359D45|nr:DEAD/DEAH box helicase family protein [Thauera sp.]MDX9885376.1 DEAD/DEAH box helicase family protein [Thauera sp.]
MTALHTEKALEDEICHDLAAADWLHDAADAARYDRALALFPDDVVGWIQTTQPEAWASIEQTHGANARKVVCERLRRTLADHGTLHVLRHGFEMLGLRRPILMAQFRPALAMNAELQAKYAANRLRVVRQLRYSLHHENCIDLGLFLNGIPVATCEIKTDYTQAVDDAVLQYRKDRPPRVAGSNAVEPLLAFPQGALVHFALSNSAVRMTTKLDGFDTVFLPFDMGDAGAAGNPPNPAGYATDYLWKDVWARDSWLEILGRYIVPRKNDARQLVNTIFPRYHQLDATRAIVAAVRRDGPGDKYLIQHSAGSGKTNSIAWTAHFLADLHDADNRKVFDTVVVVSDRTVLDDQLQEAIMGFERTQGVVAVVKGEGASKSQELAEALAAGKKIVVCTLQTFPRALDKVRELAATEGKRFAVIADEAHSSQTNETAAKLKEVLSPAELAELEDGGEISTEDILAAQMQAKAAGSFDNTRLGITFVAFTATPKDKTLQLFGTRPDPSRPPADENLPAPFHVYSMRQAIEEGFILDVLQNYTSYKVAFNLAHEGGARYSEVDRDTAMKGIMGWVRLHEYNIAQRVHIVVEHFRAHVAPLLGGQAKAMVVTASRKEAVRWQLAMRKYIDEHGYRIETLVAFSGEVEDPESAPEPLAETSALMNPRLRGRGIREAFKGGDYAILLVANKFQTGFDEPLLCGMYVDKRLAGIQAVQTLSRLNRAHPGKDTTYVVDFVNDPDEVLAAFRVYHTTAELAGVSDPEQIYTLRAKLDGLGFYDSFEVDRVVEVALHDNKQSALDRALVPVADRLIKRHAAARRRLRDADKGSPDAHAAKLELDALVLFKRDIATYVRLYGFLSQIFNYGNTDIEKRAIFFGLLHKVLDFGRESETVDLSSLALTHYTLKNLGTRRLALDAGQGEYKLKPSGPGGGEVRDKQKAALDEIIARVNLLFVGELTEGDKLLYVNNAIKGKLLECETLIEQAVNNTKEQFGNSPDLDARILDAVMDALSAFTSMSRQALESERIRAEIKAILLGPGRLYELLREAGRRGS